MENLIKPVDFAKKMGISRQAVYAKIKKGLLTSRNIGGKIFVVQDSEKVSDSAETHSVAIVRQTPDISSKDYTNHSDLLKAKDETISILKETVTDLKETNKMITSTMRGEVELLKEAFGEMKMLYRMQLEHKKDIDTIDVSSVDSIDKKSIYVNEIELESVTAVDNKANDDIKYDTKSRYKSWIELADYFNTHQIQRGRKQEKLKKVIKEMYEDGNQGIKIEDGKFFILEDSKLLKRLKKTIK